MNTQTTEAAPQPGQIISIEGKQIVASLPDKKGALTGFTVSSPPRKITFTPSEIEPLETEAEADTEAVAAFQGRVDGRRARLEGQAEASYRSYQTGFDSTKKLAEQIPFGQPLHLDGNPKRLQQDINLRNRIDKKFGKVFEALEESKQLQVKAEAVGSGGISKDDPEAIEKLFAKLNKLQSRHNFIKQSNAIIRSKKCTAEQKVKQLEDLGHETLEAKSLLLKAGYESWQGQNSNANINTTKKRIINLVAIKAKRLATGEPIRVRYDDLGITVIEDYSLAVNRLQVVFDDEAKSKLNYRLMKDNGFNYSHTNAAYQRGINTGGRWAVDRVTMALREGMTNE